MSKLCAALCLCVLFTYTGFAQSRAFQFLQLNASARAAALSGAFNAVADDPNAVFFNPASLATLEKRKIGFTFLKHGEPSGKPSHRPLFVLSPRRIRSPGGYQ